MFGRILGGMVGRSGQYQYEDRSFVGGIGQRASGAQMGAPVASAPARPSPSAPTIGRGDSVARPKGMPDYDWLVGQKTAAANGMTATTTAAGNPNSYTQTGNTFVLDKSRGTPFIMTGAMTSLTKASGGQLVGGWSYGGDANCHLPGFLSDPLWALLNANGGMAIPFGEGETLTLYHDNNNTNEQGCSASLVSYGGIGHRYPETLEDCLKVGGIKMRELWTPIVTVTPSVTVMTGGSSISTGATGTKWVDGSSDYYVLGAQPQSVLTGSGFINIAGGLPDYLKVRNNLIPFGDSKNAAVIEPAKPCFAYHPIGPFTSSNMPILNAIGTVANAQLFKLFIAKC